MTRRGLVLGAGGPLGFAWTVGALTALEQEEGFDCRGVDALVGTSAGSIAAALLGCGVSVDAMLRHQRGAPASDDPGLGYDPDADAARPPRPGWGLGSPGLLARSARHPRSVTPLAAVSSILPPGRGSLDQVRRLVVEVSGDRGWAPHPALWVVAMDYHAGRRVAFGRDGAPTASLPDAVAASCAIPGWFAPVRIDGRSYVDGGTCSATSVDLLAGTDLTEVFVLAPTVSFALDRPASVAARIERTVRRAATRRLLREAVRVRDSGIRVTVLGPGPEDLAAIGANLMDARRRDVVLATSLRTSAEALRRGPDPFDGPYAQPDSDVVG